eukprot:11302-Heterococcus_DN1.PRE.8
MTYLARPTLILIRSATRVWLAYALNHITNLNTLINWTTLCNAARSGSIGGSSSAGDLNQSVQQQQQSSSSSSSV